VALQQRRKPQRKRRLEPRKPTIGTTQTPSCRPNRDRVALMAQHPDAVGEDVVLPLYAEDVSVALRKVERGRIRVRVHTKTREHTVDEVLTHERVEMERVAIGRFVDAPPQMREEGDTTVIPVVEEVVVVQRRLILKEEIRLRRSRTTERHRENVILREQEAVIERTGPDIRGSIPLPDMSVPLQSQATKDVNE
jgi:uncharacterized protein (TIGR02271 family)